MNAPARRPRPRRLAAQDGRRYVARPGGDEWEVFDVQKSAVLMTANERLCRTHAALRNDEDARLHRRRR